MSDFLSNFDKKNYKNTLQEKENKNSKKEEVEPEDQLIGESNLNLDESKDVINGYENSKLETSEDIQMEQEEPPTLSRRSAHGEETELDPTYQKKQKKKRIIIVLTGILSLLLLCFLVYFMTHVKIPNFVSKPISEARQWAVENKVTLETKQEYSMKYDANIVIKQERPAGKQVKKKSTIKINVSLGPNPDDKIPLPNFSVLKKQDADNWVKEHKAENLSILLDYSDKVPKGQFIRQEISNKDITPATYRRKDKGIVYYSKGKEKFEKNIPMPDFFKKTKVDVETWVKRNEIDMEYQEVDSDLLEEGFIVSQSVPKETKIAKRDKMMVQVSTGKAVIVPNFADYNESSAASAIDNLSVIVKSAFSVIQPYGELVEQSIPAGTKLKEKDGKSVIVTYSAGKPYLKSYIGTLEGELDKAFFEDYRSKGARISYTVYYVNSSEIKGTVVEMSTYNEYVPLDFVVRIGVSNGSQAAAPSATPNSAEKTDE